MIKQKGKRFGKPGTSVEVCKSTPLVAKKPQKLVSLFPEEMLLVTLTFKNTNISDAFTSLFV